MVLSGGFEIGSKSSVYDVLWVAIIDEKVSDFVETTVSGFW